MCIHAHVYVYMSIFYEEYPMYVYLYMYTHIYVCRDIYLFHMKSTLFISFFVFLLFFLPCGKTISRKPSGKLVTVAELGVI